MTEHQHTDFLGQPLNVGDWVVLMQTYRSGSSTSNKRLIKRPIKRLTAKMVIYEHRFGSAPDAFEDRKVYPEHCVKFDPEALDV